MSTEETKKRVAPDDAGSAEKRAKTKQWRTPKARASQAQRQEQTIRPGDRGIWATCHKGKERRCVGELYQLFEDYAERHIQIPEEFNGLDATDATNDKETSGSTDDIESEINNEVSGMKNPPKVKLFSAIWTDVQCVVFFRVAPFIDPALVAKEVLEEAAQDPGRTRTRCTQRLTPASLVGHAYEDNLEQTAIEVLKPHFHQEPVTAKKFAIRINIRNHNTLKRDNVIHQVATLVGKPHTVDLKDPDAIILLEILKNVLTMSVVGKEYDQLKRYNLQEMYQPAAVKE